VTLTSRILAGILALTLILLLIPYELIAGEVARKVGIGESLSLICRDAYGDKDLYTLVALYNGKKDPRKINPGEMLRLPYSETITLRSGESLSILAKRAWGEPKMYPVLAWANGVQDAAKVPVGTRLSIPVLIPYVLKKGESISSVAGVFYGNPKVYEVIVNASQIEDPARVPAGTVLKIPYIMPKPVVKKTTVSKVRKPAPKPAPKPVVKKAESALKTKKALNLLEQAEIEFRAGRYGDAWTTGHEASGDLTGKDKAKALRLLAACQYAFGKTDEALEDLRRAYELDPGFKPDPAYVNPEMVVLYEKASRK
jgi:tetratricopeptide (TPR) repeat protein